MVRNKKQKTKAQVEQRDESEDEISDEKHESLVDKIYNSYGNSRIEGAVRSEFASEVSEFNIPSVPKHASNIADAKLLRAIKKKMPKVANKFGNLNKLTPLPAPLEPVKAKRIGREVGYENLKTKLDRWEDVVQGNRLEDQLQFPLNDDDIEIYDHTDLFPNLENPTPLEAEIKAVLDSSSIVKKDREKAEKSPYRLSIKELIEKRQMYAKMKAQESYKMAKANRQNKIKSKKYHRILRKEKTKQQIKDFEQLQKTDPEAALKQLEILERSRAQERATLRHRNTGKWARNQIIHAKYNKESRVAISEQLTKNRELTRKPALESDEESVESAESVDSGHEEAPSKADNPWLEEGGSYETFVTRYKSFWEQRTMEAKTADNGENNEGNGDGKSVDSGDKIVDSGDKIVDEEEVINEEVGKMLRISKEDQEVKTETELTTQKRKTKKQSVSDDSGKKGKKGIRVSKNKESGDKKDTSKKSKKRKVVKNVEIDDSENLNKLFETLEVKVNTTLKRKKDKVMSEISEVETSKTDDDAENGSKKIKKRKKTAKLDQSNDDQTSAVVPDADREDNYAKLLKVAQQMETGVPGDIDPGRYVVATRQLESAYPRLDGVEDALDDEDEESQRMTIGEAFADDDVVAEFQEEKEKVVEDSTPKITNNSMPGWGSWTSQGKDKKLRKPKINKRLMFKIPKAPPRKDTNKGFLIVNDDSSTKLKEHMVDELPFPFTQVRDFEVSIRNPIGRDWLPETAHQELIAPSVVTKIGTVIKPIDEVALQNTPIEGIAPSKGTKLRKKKKINT